MKKKEKGAAAGETGAAEPPGVGAAGTCAAGAAALGVGAAGTCTAGGGPGGGVGPIGAFCGVTEAAAGGTVVFAPSPGGCSCRSSVVLMAC